MKQIKKYNIINIAYDRENYVPAITLSKNKWDDYVAQGYNTLYGDAIIPGNTMEQGAVYQGHPRTNFETANYPYVYYTPISTPIWNS